MLTPSVLQSLQQTALVVGGANAVGFAITATFKTHQITDLVGVGSFVLATVNLTRNQLQGNQDLVLAQLIKSRIFWINAGVMVWGSRLASFLFNRILLIKEDYRLKKFFPQHGEGWFDAKKSNFPVNLAFFWLIQSIWGIICMLPVSMANSLPWQASVAVSLSNTANLLASNVAAKLIASVRPFFLVVASTLPWMPVAGMMAGM
ncbi:DUF1295 domain-containing protein [archaeon]|nr:MAG: DUF1295 domain-containing protein [archaeon]